MRCTIEHAGNIIFVDKNELEIKYPEGNKGLGPSILRVETASYSRWNGYTVSFW